MSLVEKIVGFFFKRRKTFAVLFVLSIFIAVWSVSKANFSENVYDILPVSDDTISAHLRATKFFGQTKTLYFNISGDNAESASGTLADKLAELPEIKEISGKIDTRDFRKTLTEILRFVPELFTDSDADELRKKVESKAIEDRLQGFIRKMSGFGSFGVRDVLMADPIGVLDIFYKKLKNSSDLNIASFVDGRIISPDGKNFLILAEGNFDSSDSKKSSALISKIDKIVNGLIADYPSVKIAYAGGYRISADNAKIATDDCNRCFLLTLVLMAIICLFAFRTRTFVLFAITPSLIGSAIAFVILSLLYGRIASISVAFASIAVGVSIDYAIHILYRLDSLGKLDFCKISNVAYVLSRPIAMTAGTTSIAFVIIFFCGSSGFSQLGIFGTIGVIVSALLSVFIMPIYTVGFGCNSPQNRLFDTVASKILPICKNRKISLVLMVLICICTLPFLKNLKINGDFSSLSALTSNSRADDVLIRDVWQSAVSKTYILVDCNDPDLTRKECKRLEKWLLEKNVKFFAVSSLLVDSDTRNLNIKRWEDFWSDETVSKLKNNFEFATKSVGINASVFAKAISNYQTLSSEKFNIFANENISKMFKGRFSQDGAIALQVVLPSSCNKADFSKKLKEFSPCCDYIDSTYLGEHIAKITFDWLIKFALLALIFAFGYLYFVSRSLTFVLAVLSPVILGLLWCFGILGVLGIQINVVSAIFVIFAVCLAQDYAVFLIHSSKFDEDKVSGLASILLSALTTIFAFFSLAIAQHPMLKSLGLSAGTSIFSILCACIFFSGISEKWFGGKRNG